MTGIREEFKARNAEICRLFQCGKTLQEVGDIFGITRERARQILAQQGLAAPDGGQHLRSKSRKAVRAALKDMWAQEKHGCTYQQYRSLVDADRDKPAYRRPTLAYSLQKRNARTRGISWEMKLWDWWMVWQESGKWSERGRGTGYVMAREKDAGSYHKDNVSIITANQNIKDSYINKPYTTRNIKKAGKGRKDEIFALRSSGLSVVGIAQKLGISKGTVCSYLYKKPDHAVTRHGLRPDIYGTAQ